MNKKMQNKTRKMRYLVYAKLFRAMMQRLMHFMRLLIEQAKLEICGHIFIIYIIVKHSFPFWLVR